MNSKCFFCLIRNLEKQIEKHNLDEDTAIAVIKSTHDYIHNNWLAPMPQFVAYTHHLIKEATGIDDLYLKEKSKANLLLFNNYKEWKGLAEKAENPLEMAMKLSVIGNVIDYGAHEVPEDIETEIKRMIEKQYAIDDSLQLFEEAKKAKSILYLGDNTGEIVFDRIFMELLNHNNVTYAVRNTPVLNDATIADAEFVGITDVARRTISSGFDGPSTVLSECSPDFIETYNKADLIISKGQGNLEGLMNERGRNIYFLLMAKCDVFANLFNVKKGDLIVANNKRTERWGLN